MFVALQKLPWRSSICVLPIKGKVPTCDVVLKPQKTSPLEFAENQSPHYRWRHHQTKMRILSADTKNEITYDPIQSFCNFYKQASTSAHKFSSPFFSPLSVIWSGEKKFNLRNGFLSWEIVSSLSFVSLSNSFAGSDRFSLLPHKNFLSLFSRFFFCMLQN